MPAFTLPQPKTYDAGQNDRERIRRIENYQYQLVDYLRFLFSSIDSENLGDELLRMNETVRAFTKDTGWKTQSVDASSGLSASTGDPVCVRRIGSQVYLRGTVLTGTAGTAVSGSDVIVFCTLPEEFRPSSNFYTACSAGNGKLFSLLVSANGELGVFGYTGTQAASLPLVLHASYLKD